VNPYLSLAARKCFSSAISGAQVWLAAGHKHWHSSKHSPHIRKWIASSWSCQCWMASWSPAFAWTILLILEESSCTWSSLPTSSPESALQTPQKNMRNRTLARANLFVPRSAGFVLVGTVCSKIVPSATRFGSKEFCNLNDALSQHHFISGFVWQQHCLDKSRSKLHFQW
jgi:hypothetical protein